MRLSDSQQEVQSPISLMEDESNTDDLSNDVLNTGVFEKTNSIKDISNDTFENSRNENLTFDF